MDLDHLQAVELSSWDLPRQVRADEGNLLWRGGGRSCQVGANQAGVLGRFVRLGAGSDEDIAKFASVWGVLHLCGHGLPATHASTMATAEMNGRLLPVRTCAEGEAAEPGGWVAEQLEQWRHFAAQAGAILRIAESLRLDQAIHAEAWSPLEDLFLLDPIIGDADVFAPAARGSWRRIPQSELLGVGRIGPIRVTYKASPGTALASAVRRWLELGGVRVHFDWQSGAGKLSFGGQSLFGALATLLAVGVSGSSLLLCHECKMPYTPDKRRPPADTRHFCPDCRDAGAPQRHASADYRTRKRSQAQASGQ